MLRQLVCYRRFFPFYLRTPSQSLLSRTSASQCLILLVTGGGPGICHYVFCRQIFYLHILRSHVVDLCVEFPLKDRWKGISGNDVSYKGTFLLRRYSSQLHSGTLCICCLSLLIAGCWFSDCAFCICLLLPHLFSCLRSGCQEPVLVQRSSCWWYLWWWWRWSESSLYIELRVLTNESTPSLPAR